jgi:flagellar hook-associated protein 3 FlgL
MYISRTTQSVISANAISELETNLNQINQLQNEISSGKKVNQPSDSPPDAVVAMATQSEITRVTQYQTNINDGLAQLGTADNTLQSVVTSLQSARDLVLQAANGTLSATDRAGLADQIDSIRQQLLASANTQYLGRPIFGGTSGGQQAYDPTTGAYLGNNGAVTRTIAAGTTVQVNVTGPTAFGPSGSSLFDVLGQISADMRNPNATANLTGTDLTNLDSATQNVTNALAQVGASYKQLQSQQTSNTTLLGTLQTTLSNAQDVDVAKAASDLQLQEVAYQASLAVTAKIIQPSLAEFIQ